MGHLSKLYFFLIIMIVSGCSASRQTAHIPPAPVPDQASGHLEQRDIVVHHTLESLGSPYAWGGNSPAAGFDCSGLVVFTHSRAGIHLPRTARDQFKNGRKVERSDLLPGDLVFFKIPDKENYYHVGIFIGHSNFVHAPGKGRTVTRSSLENPFFNENLIGIRSFL